MHKGCILFIMITIVSLIVTCTSVPFRYILSSSYTRDNFTGGDLNNQVISVTPILTKDGVIKDTIIAYSLLGDTLKALRPELKFNRIDPTSAFFRKVTTEDAAHFYTMLYKGEMVHLQNTDSLWNALGSDYLLVLYLRYGMSITTFNHRGKKRTRIEGELWDCHEYEVVWRIFADGWCYDNGISDIKFITYGINRIISELPALRPAYDRQQW